MLNESAITFRTWEPLLEELRWAASGHDSTVVTVGHIDEGSYGTSGVWPGHHLVMPPDFSALERIRPLLADCSVLFCGSADPDGTGEFVIVDADQPALIGTARTPDIGGIVFDPGSLPEPYRREPKHVVDARTSSGMDAGAVSRIVADALPGAAPASSGAVDTAERSFGRPLPDDVRALYRSAASGEVVVGDGGWMRICALDDLKTRRYLEPHMRMVAWEFGACEVVLPDPDGRVQPLAAPPAWFPVGDDEAGGFFVVDMEPDTQGTVGQLLHVDRDQPAGARWLAPSLTEYLIHGAELDFPLPDLEALDQALVVRVAEHTGQTLADVAPHTEVLHINDFPETVDLTSLSGHPRLRTVAVTTDDISGLDAVFDLPALEFLSLSPAQWDGLVGRRGVPAQLLAAGFDGPRDTFTGQFAVANRMLRNRRRPVIDAVRLRADTQPEVIGI